MEKITIRRGLETRRDLYVMVHFAVFGNIPLLI